MRLRDNLITELIVLTTALPSYQRAVIDLYQRWVATEDSETFAAYIKANFEMGKKEAVIEYIRRALDESDSE